MRTLRLTWRLQRWELAAVIVGCLVLAVVATWLTLDMRSILALCGTSEATTACANIFAFQETHGEAVGMTQVFIEYVPFAVGLVLGVPIVAREIEQRTAQVAWPIARSRLQWLAWRLAPVLVIGLGMAAVLGVAADQLARAYFPHSDIGFVQYDARGLPLVMRTAAILLIGVAVGTLLGRLLPALLVGIGLSVALSIGLHLALDRWVTPTMLADMEADPAAFIGGRLHTDIRYRLPSGEVVSADEGEAIVGALHEEAGGEPDAELMPVLLVYGVAPDRYWEVAARETAALGAAGVVFLAVTAVVLQRRRPE